MLNYNKITFITCIVLLLHGCASAYKPTSNVVDLSQKMSNKEAVSVIKLALVNPNIKLGICSANGIPDAGFLHNGWELNKEDPQPKATAESIDFNAFRKILSHSTSGNIATQGSAGLVTSTSTNLTPIRRSIKYVDIDSATIYYSSSALNRVCFIPDGHTEVRVSLASGIGHWFSLIIENKNLEQLIAAIMILSPEAEIQTS